MGLATGILRTSITGGTIWINLGYSGGGGSSLWNSHRGGGSTCVRPPRGCSDFINSRTPPHSLRIPAWLPLMLLKTSHASAPHAGSEEVPTVHGGCQTLATSGRGAAAFGGSSVSHIEANAASSKEEARRVEPGGEAGQSRFWRFQGGSTTETSPGRGGSGLYTN